MESFWGTVLHSWLAAPALLALVLLAWSSATVAREKPRSRASTSRTAATARMHDHRRLT